MKSINVSGYLKVVVVIGLAVLLLVGGAAFAQILVPATEPGGAVVEELPPSYISGDPAYANVLPPDENLPAGVNSPAAQFSYYQVAGTNLVPRESTTAYTYAGLGCSYDLSGAGLNLILNTELHIPEGSVIKYLRVYYNDTNPTSGVEGYITRYKPGQASADLVHTGSTNAFAGGFGFIVSAQITETVDNTLYGYTLIGWPDVVGNANQICGLRVAYYAPFHGYSFLPTIRR